MQVAEAQELLEMMKGSESCAVLMGVQTALQGVDLTTPEAAQDTGLQTQRL